MTQKQIPVRFTGEKELELYEFLKRESFETGLAMAEIIRRGLDLYRNKKEESDKPLTALNFNGREKP